MCYPLATVRWQIGVHFCAAAAVDRRRRVDVPYRKHHPALCACSPHSLWSDTYDHVTIIRQHRLHAVPKCSVVRVLHRRLASQGSWSRRTIPNKHGRRRDCGCWFQQNDVKITSLDRPACVHVCWGRSASQSTASSASAVMIGRKKSREYSI